jgi:hypothetical protein
MLFPFSYSMLQLELLKQEFIVCLLLCSVAHIIRIMAIYEQFEVEIEAVTRTVNEKIAAKKSHD